MNMIKNLKGISQTINSGKDDMKANAKARARPAGQVNDLLFGLHSPKITSSV